MGKIHSLAEELEEAERFFVQSKNEIQSENGYSYPSETPKKKKRRSKKSRISTEYSEELDKLSDVSLAEVQTNLDLLKVMRKTLIATLNTARGAFKANPSPSNVYALTRVVKDIQELTRSIETAFDYEEFTTIIFEQVIKPFLERSLLNLGSHIKDALETYAGDDPKKYKRLEKIMTETYRKYGATLEGQIPGMQARLRKTILKNAK